MMNREEEIQRIRELILRAIYSGLTEEEREELERWRGQTPRNEEVYRKLLEQRFTPGEYERYEQARSGDDWEQLRAKWRASRRRRYLSWQWMARYAAVIVLGVVLAYWFRQPEKPQRPMVVRAVQDVQPGTMKAVLELEDGVQVALGTPEVEQDERLVSRGITGQDSLVRYAGQDTRPVEHHVLRVPRGGEYVLALADGTKVWLNAETELHYPSRFEGAERRVRVVGEAYFQVTKSDSCPFIVEAGEVAVRVTGTEFNVMAYAGHDRVETTLVRGGVDVTAGNAGQRLTPGMQAVYFKEAGRLESREVDTWLYTSWKEGIFEFRDLSLGEIADQLERWYDVDIVFPNTEVSEIRFSGAVKRVKPLSFILDIIKDTRSISYRIEGKTVIIDKK
ncbi:MAG: FecR family protein [Marinifilaceae bacterium]|nr:FecR family protein [Marinifilaceae bacterium]